MSHRVPNHLTSRAVLRRAAAIAPESFDGANLRNLMAGDWKSVGVPSRQISPVDGTEFCRPGMLDPADAAGAVRASAEAHRRWAITSIDHRRAAVTAALDELSKVRDTLAELLVWEIGKPWKLACADVDRCLDGVRWYVENIEEMLSVDVEGAPYARRPLPGPVSNITSWNYPMSVLVHAELVQLLAGNAVIAKTPTQGGAAALSVAHAVMARAGLPVTLLSGKGSELSDSLVDSPEIGAVSFVGGRATGRKIAAQLARNGKRHILEQEGLNTWGLWEFSDWSAFAAQLRNSFDYAKQRCTAYPRFVVQRKLFDRFLAAYLPVVQSVRFGHPLSVDDSGDLPSLHFGPLISAAKAADLRNRVSEDIRRGAVPLYNGQLDDGRFIDGLDTSAYVAPVALLSPPGSSPFMYQEPFGPVDTVVLVDTEAELVAGMNASNGALVASLSCDSEALAIELSSEIQAFKVGLNTARSRGDREEPFGGLGGSWEGAFVGGQHLVHALTEGPTGERHYGNFKNYSRLPSA